MGFKRGKGGVIGDGMDKICIVKLRKKMVDPAVLKRERGQGNRTGEGRMTGRRTPKKVTAPRMGPFP
jgi:hypothetical protein